MIALRHPAGPLATNAYVLVDGADAVVVDPAGDADMLLALAREHGGTIRAVWLTHAHFDHVAGLQNLLDMIDVPVYLNEGDRFLFDSAAASAALYGIPVKQSVAATLPLVDTQELSIGNTTARCLWTPGHAPGHMAFYLEEAGTVLSGDALFRGSIGRTDLPFGNTATLVDAIRRRLFTLPPSTEVLPGHGEPTTIGDEIATNPFLQ